MATNSTPRGWIAKKISAEEQLATFGDEGNFVCKCGKPHSPLLELLAKQQSARQSNVVDLRK